MQLGNTEANTSGYGHAIVTKGSNSPVNINTLAKIPSALTPLLESILDSYDPVTSEPNGDDMPPKTEDKIDYNDLELYLEDIREATGFMSIVEASITSIESNSANASKKFLWAIEQRYKKVKKSVLLESGLNKFDPGSVLAFVKNNSDLLFLRVIEDLKEEVHTNKNFELETIDASIFLIVVYGFINCKILERPKL
ncbi:ABC-three component systems C-terminal domain-containing protein [Vibrio crassostreae]|uniref:Uncharacterized protein n=1 Tax=Vibrio crassostreae TaxID=246167 RepID=A0A7Y4BYW4_9VIBR|nr:ABC-three component system protein [Vibrio crassostreae]MDH5951588.1 hypothetical protein [Vibrio crassostreae]NOI54358.1 hypothetical protein [Vibrio crassostreae]TCN09466.1 hypothetical protein EDB35_105205 [Vibrio crassostreae]TCU10195.1 hypothetical protein EDB32_10499 [Vibrio crassostreae]TCV61955.1 hypothetical protein EDB74_105150 [Vibrio crassostreae]